MPVPMIRELSILRDEAARLLEIYIEHANSQDEAPRHKAYLDLDRFLMEHRKEAILLCVDGLNTEIKVMINKKLPVKKVHILSRIMMALRRRKAQEPVEYELNNLQGG